MSFYIKVRGDVNVHNFITKLETKLTRNIARGMILYVTHHLVPRMKARLSRASQQHNRAKGAKGLISKSGGYGTPKNQEDYADWKTEKTNLPDVGSLGTRELVATGHLVNSISITKMKQEMNNMLYEIGVRDYDRPKAWPFKDEKGNTQYADLNTVASNIKIAELVEESKYKFWVKEFADVRREVLPYINTLVRETIIKLLKEYGGVATL